MKFSEIHSLIRKLLRGDRKKDVLLLLLLLLLMMMMMIIIIIAVYHSLRTVD